MQKERDDDDDEDDGEDDNDDEEEEEDVEREFIPLVLSVKVLYNENKWNE